MDVLDNFFVNNKCNMFYKSINCIEDICAICNLPYDENNKITLDCKHIYHENCVNKLLNTSTYFTCPYCKNCQVTYKLQKKCKYITKDLKKCNRMCLSDIGICTFHHKYMKNNNKCMGICRSGKKCEFKKIKNYLYCKKHNKKNLKKLVES